MLLKLYNIDVMMSYCKNIVYFSEIIKLQARLCVLFNEFGPLIVLRSYPDSTIIWVSGLNALKASWNTDPR